MSIAEVASRPAERPRGLAAAVDVGHGSIFLDAPPRHRHLADIARGTTKRTPYATCVVFQGRAWSYQAIDQWAAAIATALLARPATEASTGRVGLLLKRGPGVVAGILGVLEANCAAVPFDPSQPATRTMAMLADAAPDVVLVDDAEAASDEFGLAKDRLLEIGPLAAGEVSRDRPSLPDGGGLPAYVLYTSGSTGRPKGVVCDHLGLCNLVENPPGEAPLAATSRLLLTSSVGFDPAIHNIFLAIRYGATLILVDEETAVSGAALAEVMRRESVTFIDLPPTLLAAIPPGPFPALEIVQLGGEICPQSLIDVWAPRTALYNCYGPTETAVEVTRWRWSPGEPGNRIGSPIRNAHLRVVDETGAASDEGELLVGGPMVALGYLGRAETTAERFFVCPETGLRFYRTGDRVRRVATDVYDFLGRADDQIKISGVRVEPEEVRSAIAAVPDVAQAAVLTETSEGRTMLIGFYRSADALDPTTLAEELSRRLPPAMTPARLIRVESFPTLPSGKLDLVRLRQEQPAMAPADDDVETDAARSPTALALIALWSSILNRPKVRLSDNFFSLGGDSLRLTQMIFAINQRYRVRLTPSLYRGLPDLRSLVDYVDRALASTHRAAPGDGNRQAEAGE